MAKKVFIVTLHDGTELEVTPTLQDTLAFETAVRKNPTWGGLKNSILKLEPFRAWNALRREGRLDLSWEEFTKGELAAQDVVSKEDEPEDEDDTLEEEGLGKGSKTAASKKSSSPSLSAPASPTESGSGTPDATTA